MTLLDAARQLARTGPYLLEGSHCMLCDRVIVGFADVGPEDHVDDCPAASWPQILAVLEAASALITAENAQPWGMQTPMSLQAFSGDPACYWCAGDKDDHRDDCPWQALVKAFAAEPAPAEVVP